MSLKKIFGTDKSKEVDGVWIDVTENEDGSQCRFKISRMGATNRKFANKIAKRHKKYRGRFDTVGTEKLQADLIDVFAETVLIDWQNVIDWREPNVGKPVPFTKENAVWLMNELPDLFDLLTKEATEISNFQSEANEAEAKN